MSTIAHEVGEPTTGGAFRRRPWFVWGVPVVLLLLAAGIRLWALGDPVRLYFDEKYYVADALDYLDRGVEEARPAHPPLGKWVIAAGIAIFGDTPFGWRVAVAAAGSASVLVTYLVGLRLFRRELPAALAGLLVAVDGLAVTASRIAMLDAVLGLFVLLAIWLVLLDRDARARTRVPDEPLRASLVGSRYRWWAGVALGLAVATKWPGLLAVAAAGLLVLGSELFGRGEGARRTIRRAAAVAAGAAVSLLLVPGAIYLASYTGWFTHYEQTSAASTACAAGSCGTSAGDRLTTWVDSQVDLAGYHVDLEATNAYRSSPLGWPWLQRPVLVYAESCTPAQADAQECVVPAGERARIVMLGNPALWWPALLAYPVLVWRVIRHRDAVAATILVPLVVLWAPWLAENKPGYFFYLVPVVPFIALALVRALQVLPRPHLSGAAVAVLAVGCFGFFAPIWLGTPVGSAALELRFWLSSWR